MAWFSEKEPRRGNAHQHVFPGEPGGGNTSLAISPDGTRMATTDTGGHVAVWHTDDGWWSEDLLEIGGFANTAVFSPDGRFLAIGGTRLILWELGLGGGRQALQIPLGGVKALAFSPDGKTLAVTFEKNGNVILWDLAEGRKRASFPSDADSIRHIAFSPDGRCLVAGGISTIASIAVWDVITGECVLRLNGDFGPVRALAFSRDGTSFAMAGAFRTARAPLGREIRAIAPFVYRS